MKYLLFGVITLIAQLMAFEVKVRYVSGLAELYENNKKLSKLAVGQEINLGQVIKTGSNSLVVVALEGGSLLKLKESSELRFDQFTGSAAQANRKSSFTLLGGGLFSKVSKLVGSETFNVQTPTMVAGVRGTSFFIAYGKKAAKEESEDLWLCVNEGNVEVGTTSSPQKVMVKPGEGIIVPGGKKVTKPKPYAWTKNLNWNFDTTSGELTDKTKMESMYQEPLDFHYD